MTTHTVSFYYATGQTLTAKVFTSADVLEDEASSVTEATNRKQRYVATFEDVAAGDYMLVYYVAGDPAGFEIVRFTGVDGEVAVLLDERNAVLDSALQTQIDAIVDGIGWTLASLYGACANPQAADALVQLSINGYAYSGQYAGLTATGVRTAPSLTKV